MSYAADRTEDAEQAAPVPSATQNADAVEPVVQATEATPTEVPAEVVDLARAAAVTEAGDEDSIGEHLDTLAEDPVARTVRFAALAAGYRGWQWSVTLAVLPDADPTVSEVVLLPGPDALIAPVWLPWDQRLRPGDLGPSDLLPAAEDDVRLVPGYVQSDDPAIEELATEVGLGRERVLSREGRDDAAERWHDGPFGPTSPTAKAAPAHCGTCGFFAPLAGSLGGAFGVCANEWSPADARVVDVAFGCGAHSEVPPPPPAVVIGETALDEVTLDVYPRPSAEERAAAGVVDPEPTDAPSVDEPVATAETDGAAPASDARLIDLVPAVAETGDELPDVELVTAESDVVDGLSASAQDESHVDGPVAVEPEVVTSAGAVAGPEAEIVLPEPAAPSPSPSATDAVPQDVAPSVDDSRDAGTEQDPLADPADG
ncbi:DUF3027 domain-containing protein [Nakamurella flava]|uniref:DUF3027 domain-containing protein n=2 Tax=Nakamurella flava TaxID=2576308 RepID=A0A4U6QNL8_9ACTN|nr:DUF3027 domain-containing protein [Nakamurella flava]